MLLRGEQQLAAHLERELRLLYVVYGDDPLLVIEAADAIRAKARQQGYGEREVLTVLPSFDWNQLLAAGGNLSLFGDRKLIDLRIPTGKPGKEGGAALEEWCRHQSPDNLLLITLPELDWREEKAAWFTALVNAGVVIRLVAPTLAELPGWLAGRLRRQQQSANEESLRFIAERVEGNLLAAHQEIQKLGLLHPAGHLSGAQVREAVLNVARYDIDGLREALLAGDVARLARTLDGLMHEGEAAAAGALGDVRGDPGAGRDSRRHRRWPPARCAAEGREGLGAAPASGEKGPRPAVNRDTRSGATACGENRPAGQGTRPGQHLGRIPAPGFAPRRNQVTRRRFRQPENQARCPPTDRPHRYWCDADKTCCFPLPDILRGILRPQRRR